MPPQQPQSQGQENSLDFLWTIVLIIAAVLLTWHFGKVYIVTGIFYIKTWEIIATKAVLGFFNQLLNFLHLNIDLTSLDKSMTVIRKQIGTPVDFKTVTEISTNIGRFIRYPIILILLLIAVRLYFGSISSQYKTVFNMKKLKDAEKINWPRITSVVNLNLIEEDVNKGPWAMAMNPMQFCKKYNLLEEYSKDGKPAVYLKRGAAHRILALQLGPLWTSNLEALPEHIQALLAVFAARIDNDLESADKLLDQIGASSGGGKLDFSGTRMLLRKHINNKLAIKTMSKHAYVTTMMASMLDLSRGAGVLATSDFLWLKPLDRKMWYVLNSVGRQTAVPEVAGFFSHWLMEKKLEYPLKTPMVDSAVNGLEEGLGEIIYEPEEEE